MIKTLKGKLTLINVILILFTTLIGIVSLLNLFVIYKDINGFLKNNYISIQAVNGMKDALYNEQYGLFLYLNDKEEEGLDYYSKNNYLFLENLHIEKNNITEKGEKDCANKLDDYYSQYSNNFFTFIDIYTRKGKETANEFFYDDVKISHDNIVDTLNEISKINESNMINSQNTVKNKINIIINITIFLTCISILISFVWSKKLLKKILSPLNTIINGIKDIKTKSEYKELDVTTEDEFGELTNQFNLMAKRIKSFEESTFGEILKEKNNANAILKSIDSPMVVLDNDFRVAMANDDFLNLFNLDSEDIEEKYLTHLVKDRNFFSLVYDISMNNCKNQVESLYTFKNEAGDLRYYNVSISKIEEEFDEIGMVVLLKDITYLKETEQVSKDFFATISHEFKTPLTSIMIGTGLLESNKIGDLNEEQSKILDTIKEDGERLNLLVSNMLLLSRLDSYNEIYRKDYQNIDELIKASVDSNKEIANYNGIVLEYFVDKNVKPLLCDGEKIIWVINNLITNAIRHCEDGDLISIRSFSENDSLNITVTDTGLGILKEYNESIFSKFFQIENKDIIKKSGLGLWICKDIVTAHNGTIKCESDIGEGATFTISIPYI